MANYKVVIKRSATAEFESIGAKKDRARVVATIRSLASEPRPPGCQKLSGASKYRVRQGHYRIVHAIDDATAVITIVKIGHRREAYR